MKEPEAKPDMDSQPEQPGLLKLFWSPTGRISRKPFALNMPALVLVSWLLFVFSGQFPFVERQVSPVQLMLTFIVSVGLLWAMLVVTMKRLHDIGCSGWIGVVPVVILSIITNFAGFLLLMLALDGLSHVTPVASGTSSLASDALAFLSFVTVMGAFQVLPILVLGGFLLLAAMPGTNGPNRFGQSPLG